LDRGKRHVIGRTEGKVQMFSRFSNWWAIVLGKPLAFIIACTFTLLWAVSGPVFDYSDTWQLIINTSTTVITFLMLFIVQHTQNSDTSAIQRKLDELILALEEPDDAIAGIEHKDDDDDSS
jgi:low affinity Fe/Cu permease